MKKAQLLLATVVALAVWTVGTSSIRPFVAGKESAQGSDEGRLAGERGLPVSAAAPSFMPLHATGPNAGRRACPLCIYGLGPQFQLWVEEPKLRSAIRLMELLDAEALRSPSKPNRKQDSFVPYLVVAAANGKDLSAESMRLIKSLNLQRLFVTVAPSWDDDETSALYGHSVKDRPGARGYLIVNRRVYKRWDAPSDRNWPEMAKALKGGRAYVTSYELADAQIAPGWEPGQKLAVRFRVVNAKGQPQSQVKVSASQADKSGHYNPPGWNRRTPRLSTVAWTNKDGWIPFSTIMPGPYPNEIEPAHIHFTVSVNGKNQFRTLWFEGDPLLTQERRAWADKDEETLIVPIDRTSTPWKVEHTFIVGE